MGEPGVSTVQEGWVLSSACLPAGLQACQLALSTRTVWARCPNGDLARRYGITDKNPAGDYWKKIPGNVLCFTGRCWGMVGFEAPGDPGQISGAYEKVAPTWPCTSEPEPKPGHLLGEPAVQAPG